MKYLGILVIVLAIALAVVPAFTNCSAQGSFLTTAAGKQIDMKCHWSAQAEIALGIPLIGVGAMMALSRRKESLRSISILGVVLGAIAISVPTTLIGVCSMPTHICVAAMKPAVLTFGGLIAIGSIGGIFLSQRAKD